MTTIPDNSKDKPERFSRLEDPGTDFPFYKGSPVSITNGQWVFVMAAVAAAFTALLLSSLWTGKFLWSFIPAVTLAAVPLLAMARVAPLHWRCLFGMVRGRELRLMLGFALLNFVVTMALGTVVMALTHVSGNGSTEQLGSMDIAGRLVFLQKQFRSC